MLLLLVFHWNCIALGTQGMHLGLLVQNEFDFKKKIAYFE